MENAKSPSIKFRFATIEDCDTLVSLIKCLGFYEKATEKQMPVTAELLKYNVFEKKYCEILIAELNSAPAGYCCFFHNFSTWLGKPGIWIEDIFVKPEFRRQGIGSRFFQEVAKICCDRDCQRLEWSCLNWNEPALDFYRKLGASQMSEWTQHRLEVDGIKALAQKKI